MIPHPRFLKIQIIETSGFLDVEVPTHKAQGSISKIQFFEIYKLLKLPDFQILDAAKVMTCPLTCRIQVGKTLD
jgi:hypothetical protein